MLWFIALLLSLCPFNIWKSEVVHLAAHGICFGRRSFVLDEHDQTMRIALALWGAGRALPLELSQASLKVSVCLIRMEEDEADIPVMINEDEEAFICPSDHFDYIMEAKAFPKDNNGESYPSISKIIQRNSTAVFEFDLSENFKGANTFSFRHEETGAMCEIEINSNENAIETNDHSDNLMKTYEDDEMGYFRHRVESGGDRYESDDDSFIAMDGEVDYEKGHAPEDSDEEYLCDICKEPGEVMVCEGGQPNIGCGKCFHIKCVNRKVIPEGDWVCQSCANSHEGGGVTLWVDARLRS